MSRAALPNSESRQVFVPYNPEQVGEFQREIGELVTKMEAEKRELADRQKPDRDRLTDLKSRIRKGGEDTTIECSWRKDYEAQKAYLHRPDTGEVVDEVYLSDSDKQADLFMNPQNVLEFKALDGGKGEEDEDSDDDSDEDPLGGISPDAEHSTVPATLVTESRFLGLVALVGDDTMGIQPHEVERLMEFAARQGDCGSQGEDFYVWAVAQHLTDETRAAFEAWDKARLPAETQDNDDPFANVTASRKRAPRQA